LAHALPALRVFATRQADAQTQFDSVSLHQRLTTLQPNTKMQIAAEPRVLPADKAIAEPAGCVGCNRCVYRQWLRFAKGDEHDDDAAAEPDELVDSKRTGGRGRKRASGSSSPKPAPKRRVVASEHVWCMSCCVGA
jgi:hypothetical protein